MFNNFIVAKSIRLAAFVDLVKSCGVAIYNTIKVGDTVQYSDDDFALYTKVLSSGSPLAFIHEVLNTRGD